jgi:hypothetical protein
MIRGGGEEQAKRETRTNRSAIFFRDIILFLPFLKNAFLSARFAMGKLKGSKIADFLNFCNPNS